MLSPPINNHIVTRLKEDRGNCFLWGCASLILVTILGSIFLWLTVRYMVSQVREQYTEADPAELPVVDRPQEEIDALIDEVDDFTDGLEDEALLDPLVLTQEDLNTLIQHHPDFEEMSNVVYVTIEDDVVTGQLSVPLDEIPGFEGRYFNGSATFDVGLENGRLTVYVDAATVGEETVPETAMQGVRSENFGQVVTDDPEKSAWIDQLDTLRVEDGVVTITPLNVTPPEPAATETESL